MDWAALNGERVITARVTIPYYGAWCADVVLAVSQSISREASLVIGDLSLTGFVERVADFAGSRSARLVGGFGGWQKVAQARAYSNPSGLLLSMILRDVATEVGEVLAIGTDSIVGPAYVREAAPAQRVLRQLAGPLWWIDAAGTTQIGSSRSNAPITSEFNALLWSGGKGQLSIATETLADWMPGRTFTAPTVSPAQTISLTNLSLDNDGKLRLDVLTTP